MSRITCSDLDLTMADQMPDDGALTNEENESPIIRVLKSDVPEYVHP